MRVQFLVLACSFKHGERCVAGIDLVNRQLIRLVSHNEETNFAIPTNECRINGRMLLPLDIIEIEIIGKAPRLGAQTENYFVEFPLIKKYIGRGAEKDIKPYKFRSEKSPYPFDTKDSFLSHGAYFYKDYSLCLIPAYSLMLKSVKNSEGKDKTKVSFNVYKYNKEIVTLEDYYVTDPEYCIFDGGNRVGLQTLGKAYLLISLGQDDDSNSYYKYVSGIIDFTKREDFFAE